MKKACLPKEATKRSMGQITGALVGIGLVLSGGVRADGLLRRLHGVIYRQFSITIVAAMALSVLVAIVFTPALCATMLKPVEKGHEHGEGGLLGGFFHWFNTKFERGTRRYESAVGGILRRSLRFMLIYAVIVAVLGFLFVRMPTSFLPEEDQGDVQPGDVAAGARQERTLAVLGRSRSTFSKTRRTRYVRCSPSPASALAAAAEHGHRPL